MEGRRKVLELFEEQKDFMEERINNGIELYRKGYAKIIIKDSNGVLVTNAKITAKQKSHEFKFGANIFMLDELETDEKNEKYKKTFVKSLIWQRCRFTGMRPNLKKDRRDMIKTAKKYIDDHL